VLADWWFTTPAVVLQPLTGILLLGKLGIAWTQGWVVASLVLYGLIGACWLPVVVIQLRVRDLAVSAAQRGEALPPAYHRLMRWWFALGWPAFFAVIAVFWLMLRKPVW